MRAPDIDNISAFRDQISAFIADNFDAELRLAMQRSQNGYIAKQLHIRWQKRLYEQGWIAPNWPKEYGGPGWNPLQRYIFQVEMNKAGTPAVIPFGIRMVGPIIMKFGSDEQKRKYLPEILRSDAWWCQGFSEYGAGSDLASLQMTAEITENDFVCNGRKVWTTLAHFADMMFCLVRTAKSRAPFAGISFILVDMTTPGITIRPIQTIDGAPIGQHEVNEVIFDNVHVPRANLVGELNKGWACTRYLLDFERSGIHAGHLRRALAHLKHSISTNDVLIDQIPTLQRRLLEAEIQVTAYEAFEQSIMQRAVTGANSGLSSSVTKIMSSELLQFIGDITLDVYGLQAHRLYGRALDSSDDFTNHPQVISRYLNQRKLSIHAGTNEIQRNIIAKLILGL